jgi:hypothetical protein
MKKILTLSFIIFSTFIPLHSWALPACPSNQNAYYHNCFGTYEWTSGKFKGDKYVGEWKDNKKHGQGTYYYLANNENKNDKYSGEYKDGEMHGQGTYIYADGDKYVGEFKDSKRNGYFIVTYKTGDRYEGEFIDDKRSGQGTYTFPNGEKYVGEFKDGLSSGQGTFTWADGTKDVGEFRNDKLNGFAIRYDKNGNILKEGIWKDDEFQYAQKQSSGSSNSNSKLNKYKEFCKEIGFTPGTEKFGDCVLKAMEVE